MGGEERAISNHPSGEQLLAYASGEVDATAGTAISGHIAACAECDGVVARYRLVQGVLRADDAAEPPPALVTRAKALFAGTPNPDPAPRPDVLLPLRRVIAELVFDSGAALAPAMAGFRGTGDRHLTYVAESVQIDLRVRPPEGREGAWRVMGQVDAEKLVPATPVDMVRAGENEAVVRATTDEHGMFDLAAPAGRYDLLIRLPCALQVLPGLVLG